MRVQPSPERSQASSSQDDRPATRKVGSDAEEVKAAPTAFFGEAKVDDGNGVDRPVDDVLKVTLQTEDFGDVQVADEHRELHGPAVPLQGSMDRPEATRIPDVIGDEVTMSYQFFLTSS